MHLTAYPFPVRSHLQPLSPPGLEPVHLHYLTYGNPANPAVYCLHGLSCNGHDFDYLAAPLAQDFFVIAPDMPGRGLSSHLSDPAGYTNDNHTTYSLALLDALGIEHVHWIGASMGGIMGMIACSWQPERIRTLTLNDVGHTLAAEGLEDIRCYTGKSLPVGDNAALEARLRHSYSAFHFEQEAYWQHFFRSRIRVQADGTYTLRNDPGIIQPLLSLLEHVQEGEDVSLEALWSSVTCPVLLLRGEQSLLLRKDTAEAMRRQDSKRVTWHEILDTGHMPHLMNPHQTGLIHTWLKGHENVGTLKT